MSHTAARAALDREPVTDVTPDRLDEALERVLGSRIFQKAQRSRRFLRYLVEAHRAKPPIAVKEYTIAIDVFDRDTTYDPAVDATVRVEASRLRSRLREYYADEGREDPWMLDVPKGSYAVVLSQRPGAAPVLLPIPRQEPLPGTNHGPSEPRPEPRPGVPPRGGSRWPRWLTAASLLAALIGIAMEGHSRLKSTPVVPTPAPVSLAVLPVRNETGDAGLDVPAEGLTDDLIRQFAQIPALRLLSRTTVFHYGTPNSDPQSMGKALGVDTVLLSELRRTQDNLVIAAELSSTRDGSALLDRQYIVEGHDLGSAQAALQRDVVDRLHVEGSARDPGRKLGSVTRNPQAYREFREGGILARSGAPADLRAAMEHFQRAVSLDPGFDLGWSALASEHLLLGLYFEAPRDHMPLARQFVQKALAINPTLGEAHGTLGLLHLVYDWNLPAAEAEMGAAGAEQGSISSLACTAHLLEGAGQPRTAEEVLGRMLSFDPHSGALLAELGCVDYYHGHYESALRHYKVALADDPHSPLPYWGLGKTLNAEGRYAEAVASLQEFKRVNGFEPPLLTAETGYALGASGERARASASIATLAQERAHSYVDPYLTAVIYASMHDHDATFAWLDKALSVRSSMVISILSDPKWEPFRSDPRFARLVGRMQSEPAV